MYKIKYNFENIIPAKCQKNVYLLKGVIRFKKFVSVASS